MHAAPRPIRSEQPGLRSVALICAGRLQGKNTWSIIRQGSPGNLESFEDIVFDGGGDAQDTPIACCVQVSQGDAGWKVCVSALRPRHGCRASQACHQAVRARG